MTTVLLIEPNVKLGLLYCEFLTRADFTVHQQLTCEQGVEYLSHTCIPDMIIIDPSLTQADCSPLMGYLSSHEQFQHTQVVMMIGSEHQQQEQAEAIGIKHFLYKPISLSTLVMFMVNWVKCGPFLGRNLGHRRETRESTMQGLEKAHYMGVWSSLFCQLATSLGGWGTGLKPVQRSAGATQDQAG